MRKGISNSGSFESLYPHIADWISGGGWIEIGNDDSGYIHSFVRAFDGGGMIYEGATKYETMDEALHALDTGIKEWLDVHG